MQKIIMNRSAVLVILIPLQTFRSWPLISGVPSTLESLQDLHTPRNRFFFFLHLFEVSSVGFEHQSVSHCYECNKQSFFIIEANIAMATVQRD